MSATVDYQAIAAASASFPKPPAFTPVYGTAGFRGEASQLDSTVFRCGLLAAARALVTRRATGLMITASHNPAQDNGVKLAEPDGEMLPQSLEPLATELAQCDSDERVAELVNRLLREDANAEPAPPSTPGSHGPSASGPLVIIGHDTRASGPKLLQAAEAGIKAMGVAIDVAGQVTTPQLHWIVNCHNSRSDHPSAEQCLHKYLDALLGSFEETIRRLPPTASHDITSPHGPQLYIDCANGVGAVLLAATEKRLKKSGLMYDLHNTGNGKLNHNCGADFVQKECVTPATMDKLMPGARCASIDGDADRIVFFTPATGLSNAARSPKGKTPITLLDGDKIAALAATVIKDLVDQLPSDFSIPGAGAPRVGVIQTAYSNGASTAYLTKTLSLPVECTSTGVKYLHHAAQKYDIGIYWESNGHGTILFSPAFLAALGKLQKESAAARELLVLSRMVNQTVGDALSGVLLVDSVLRQKEWDFDDWNKKLYQDLPSKQRKLQVSNRAAITTTDSERLCVQPEGLQEAINKAVASFPEGARAFVRPSGTEDAVRVYAEAPSQEQADDLALQVSQLVYDMAGGVGSRP